MSTPKILDSAYPLLESGTECDGKGLRSLQVNAFCPVWAKRDLGDVYGNPYNPTGAAQEWAFFGNV